MESYTWSVLILTNNEDSIFLKIFCSLFRVGCSISFFPSQVEGYVRFSHNSARRHPPKKFKKKNLLFLEGLVHLCLSVFGL